MNLRCFNPQFFFASKVGDVALKQGWEQSLRSDDRRLGVVLDAVQVLCAVLPPDGLSPADLLALDRVKELGQPAESSDRRDAAGDASLTTADVDNLIAKLRRLRQEDSESAGQIVRRIIEQAGPPAGAVTG